MRDLFTYRTVARGWSHPRVTARMISPRRW
jgi:hypothetical protein